MARVPFKNNNATNPILKMKTLISTIGNDFCKKYILEVETKKTEIKTFENYRIENPYTKELINDMKRLHGAENVKVSDPMEDWAGDLVVNIEVKKNIWDCVFETPSSVQIKKMEKIWKAKN